MQESFKKMTNVRKAQKLRKQFKQYKKKLESSKIKEKLKKVL